MRELWRRKLARLAGFVVLDEFADAETVLAGLGTTWRVPQFILVDWNLGEGRMNGIEFIRRSKARFPRLCCVLITAYDEVPDL
ncbi:MAG: response regulator, partial [Verrucomicrobia bacterium]|nr:response regulator [Verrucomicrobiota bacterium]